jgi:hypothetical protein
VNSVQTLQVLVTAEKVDDGLKRVRKISRILEHNGPLSSLADCSADEGGEDEEDEEDEDDDEEDATGNCSADDDDESEDDFASRHDDGVASYGEVIAGTDGVASYGEVIAGTDGVDAAAAAAAEAIERKQSDVDFDDLVQRLVSTLCIYLIKDRFQNTSVGSSLCSLVII